MSWGNVCVTVPVCCWAWEGPNALMGTWRGSGEQGGDNIVPICHRWQDMVNMKFCCNVPFYKGNNFDF